MNSDYTDYVDPQGFATRDYTMDPSDVARLGLVSSGTTRSGLPVVNTDNDAWTRHFLGGAPDSTDLSNMAAVGMGGAPVVTSQPRATGSNAGAGIPTLPFQGPGGFPSLLSPADQARSGAMGPFAAFQQSVEDRDTNASQASILQDYSTPEATAKTRAQLASFIPGGANLRAAMVASGAIDDSALPGGNLTSGLTDSEGKALPGNQLNMKMLSDPRFQQLRKMDQLNGTNNADRFYASQNNGRSLTADLAANQALQAAQTTNKLKDANDLQKELAIAPKDDLALGIHAGDFVRQKVVNGIMPGTDSVTHVPLTDYERELAGLAPDPTGKLDSFGRPVYNPTGNSFLKQATGLPSATDLAYGHALLARKTNAANAAKVQNTAAATAMPAPSTDPTPSWMDKGDAVGYNAAVGALNLITHPVDTIMGGGAPSNAYITPTDVARMRATKVASKDTLGDKLSKWWQDVNDSVEAPQ